MQPLKTISPPKFIPGADRPNAMTRTSIKFQKLYKNTSKSKDAKDTIQKFDKMLNTLNKSSISTALLASAAIKAESI